MRIIGGKDYYDSARAFGPDDGAVFARRGYPRDLMFNLPTNHQKYEAKELAETPVRIDFTNVEKTMCFQNSEFTVKGGRVRIAPVTVWFCGKRYGGLRWTFTDSCWGKRAEATADAYNGVYWCLDAFLESLEENGVRLADRSRDARSGALATLRLHFGTRQNSGAADFLARESIAIAVLDTSLIHWGWIVNADVLKYVEFQKAMPAWEAMQELSMYVDGILPGHANPMVRIADPVRIAKHGFDKWSFRRMPAEGGRHG